MNLIETIRKSKKSTIKSLDLDEMARDPVQLARHLAAQCRGDFEVVTADRQVHE